MNVSLPGYNLANLDYVKMALFLGDKYVLQTFNRLGNSYARSAIDNIEQVIKRDPGKAESALTLMRSNLNSAVSKMIHDSRTDKFTSINTKDNRIEIRSPGGNWLDMDLDAVINTLYRTVYALSIALDPQAEKEEYAKKFYKMLAAGAPKDETDTIKYFSQYVTGTIPKAALLANIRNVQAKRDIARGKKPVGSEFGGPNEYRIEEYPSGRLISKFTNNDPFRAYTYARDLVQRDGSYYLNEVQLVRVSTGAVLRNLNPVIPPASFTEDSNPLGRGANAYWIVYKGTDLLIKAVRADNSSDAVDLARNWLDSHNANYNNYTIRYVYNKWKDKKPAGRSFGPLDEEVIDNIRGDLYDGELTQQQIAIKYKTTRATVNKWAKRFGLSKRSPPDVKTKAASNS